MKTKMDIPDKEGRKRLVIVGGGFGGCTINLVKNELYETFISTAKERFKEKFGRSPKVYDVVISDGSHKVC